MKLKIWFLGLLTLLAVTPLALADGTNSIAIDTNQLAALKSYMESVKLAASLKYQHGVINLPGGVATINLPTNICYLSPDDADTVLVKIWNNPPSAKTLGMLVPADKKPTDDGCWAVAITSTEDGYVKDGDAGKINYDDLLKQMKEGTHDENKDRVARGYPSVELVGWAEPPHYDATTHKLYWAEELKVDGAPENTLNYDIRILGRKGYLVLGAIAGMSQLQEIRDETPRILAAVDFNEGNRYSDFDPKVDKVATYGIAALVLGGIAVKAGLFKVLLVGLLAAKKFIIIAAVAIGTWFKKFFGKRKDSNP
jgi:uncharacterized membrane-anchored protein